MWVEKVGDLCIYVSTKNLNYIQKKRLELEKGNKIISSMQCTKGYCIPITKTTEVNKSESWHIVFCVCMYPPVMKTPNKNCWTYSLHTKSYVFIYNIYPGWLFGHHGNHKDEQIVCGDIWPSVYVRLHQKLKLWKNVRDTAWKWNPT